MVELDMSLLVSLYIIIYTRDVDAALNYTRTTENQNSYIIY